MQPADVTECYLPGTLQALRQEWWRVRPGPYLRSRWWNVCICWVTACSAPDISCYTSQNSLSLICGHKGVANLTPFECVNDAIFSLNLIHALSTLRLHLVVVFWTRIHAPPSAGATSREHHDSSSCEDAAQSSRFHPCVINYVKLGHSQGCGLFFALWKNEKWMEYSVFKMPRLCWWRTYMLPGARAGIGSTGQFLCGDTRFCVLVVVVTACISTCDKISYSYVLPKCVCVKTGEI